MIVAIIPARGGSQRIKKKNIKKFCSKPILYWTINALKNNILDNIVTASNIKIVLATHWQQKIVKIV
jgi:N-acylneuraminate cytidylyltransferase